MSEETVSSPDLDFDPPCSQCEEDPQDCQCEIILDYSDYDRDQGNW